MVIRDDRGAPQRDHAGPPPLPTAEEVKDVPAWLTPDAVLLDCRLCGRAHFATAGPCPDAATAAAEAGLVRRAA